MRPHYALLPSRTNTENYSKSSIRNQYLKRMRFVGLISGGKDLFYNIHHCLTQGHELVALCNLYPAKGDELDLYMFQTVGHDVIEYYCKCFPVPVYRREISGSSTNQNLEYETTVNDEIEDMYELLASTKRHHPDIIGVSCGAILSHYQRTRVENVCDRLGLTSLTFLWQRDQSELMGEMAQLGLDARLIKVAAMGLDKTHLGQTIQLMYPTLLLLNQQFDVHVCGEGGEFETMVFDACFFEKKLVIRLQEVKEHASGVAYLRLKVDVEEKPQITFFPAVVPPLLALSFVEILDKLADLLDDHPSIQNEGLINHSENGNGEVSTENNDSLECFDKSMTKELPSVLETPTRFYISNLSGTGSLREQIASIFLQLKGILADKNLIFSDLASVTLLLSDMSDFEAINEVYSRIFARQYLPPARICVATVLGTRVQMLCVLHKNRVQSKSGVHIRLRSYWAPQNIGPYSQAIVDVRSDHRQALLAGQIPLVPATMALSQASPIHQIVLALQHLHRALEIVGTSRFDLVICFIIDSKWVELVRRVWQHYDGSKVLVIVQVQQLPRNALVEWGGTSFEESRVDLCYESDNEEGDNLSAIARAFAGCSYDFIKYGPRTTVTAFTSDRSTLRSLPGALTIFVDVADDTIEPTSQSNASDSANLLELTQSLSSSEIIPVLGIWASEGEPHKFAAVARLE